MGKQTKAAYHIDIQTCCKVIDDWMSKGKNYAWKTEHEIVQAKLIAAANNSVIDHDDALAILRAAKTTKMLGTANAGMGYIEQEWRRLRVSFGYRK